MQNAKVKVQNDKLKLKMFLLNHIFIFWIVILIFDI